MTNQKDNLFAKPGPVKPFEFDDSVSLVFDDMIKRSVPFYQHVQDCILKLIQKLPQKQTIYDLGTSTGNLIFFLAEHLQKTNSHFIGIDHSKAMIEHAKTKQKTRQTPHKIEFITADILDTDFKKADVIILNYVLQFLKPDHRLEFLKTLHDSLEPHGILIVSEKTKPADSRLSKIFRECHEDFKQQNHYSHLEISQKRKSLENVLIPLSLNQNMKRLQEAGFSVEPFLVWHNFASFCAFKSL